MTGGEEKKSLRIISPLGPGGVGRRRRDQFLKNHFSPSLFLSSFSPFSLLGIYAKSHEVDAGIYSSILEGPSRGQIIIKCWETQLDFSWWGKKRKRRNNIQRQ